MIWKQQGPRYHVAVIGHLFADIMTFDEACDWQIGVESDDKRDLVYLATGRGRTLDQAKHQAAEAIGELLKDALDDLEATIETVDTAEITRPLRRFPRP